MDLELVGDPLCPYVQRVAVTLEALDLEYTCRETDPDTEDAMDMHPLGEVPVLVVEGEPLFESTAIGEYLNDLSGGALLPSGAPARARARAWIHFSGACQQELERTMEAAEERDFLHHRAELYYKLGRLEAELGDEPFWDGHRPGLVDFTYTPLLMRIEHLARRTGTFDLSGFPNVEDWTYELVGHHAVKAVMPRSFEDAHLELVERKGGYIARIVRA